VKVHTTEVDADLTKLWCDLREKTSLVSTDGEYVGGQSGYGELVCSFCLKGVLLLSLLLWVASAHRRRILGWILYVSSLFAAEGRRLT
jgi:hypothetical protein